MSDLPDMEEPPHPGVGRALELNEKAATLQARADVAPGPDGFRLELRAGAGAGVAPDRPRRGGGRRGWVRPLSPTAPRS